MCDVMSLNMLFCLYCVTKTGVYLDGTFVLMHRAGKWSNFALLKEMSVWGNF